jgi:hypothetical protein
MSGSAQHVAQSGTGGRMEDTVIDMLAWLLEKTEEDIVAEVEVATLNSMFLVEDPRPECLQ